MEKELQKIFDTLRKDSDFEDLTDEEILEMAKMELGAKDIKTYAQSKKPKKERKTPTKVVSDAKKELFSDIFNSLSAIYEYVTVEKDNKLIIIEFDNKIFKLDLIETRQKK